MSDRDTILAAIRTRKRPAARGESTVVPVPARGRIDGAARIDLFVRMAEAAAATVKRLSSPEEVPEAVAQYLAAQNLPARLVLASDPRVANLPWEEHPMIAHRTGPATGQDHAALTAGFAGVAETGTLALVSSAETPTTLNFLPEHSLVLVSAEDICGTYEELWRRLRLATDGGAYWPRTVNLITGPSRSADIEQKLLMGAHGPVKLHILLIDP
ncbi:MAG: lactate utilization protein [Dongiaceae bacterium]